MEVRDIFRIGPTRVMESVSTGRIRCDTADWNMAMFPVSSVSIRIIPVTCGGEEN